MADCFWTDLVGCTEDCGGGPPPETPGVFNARTWIVPLGGAEEGCVIVPADPLNGDEFGDARRYVAGPMSVPVPVYDEAIVPTESIRVTSHGAPPDCVVSACGFCGFETAFSAMFTIKKGDGSAFTINDLTAPSFGVVFTTGVSLNSDTENFPIYGGAEFTYDVNPIIDPDDATVAYCTTAAIGGINGISGTTTDPVVASLRLANKGSKSGVDYVIIAVEINVELGCAC